MRLALLSSVIVALSGLACEPASASFVDSFDTEHGGTGTPNYSGFANWTVSTGTVDLLGPGYVDLLPGHGLYIDLDGTAGGAGRFTSRAIDLQPGLYELSFDLAGSQRGDTNTVTVALLGTAWTTSITLVSSAALTTYSSGVIAIASPTTVQIQFQNSGNDNKGALLDNVQLVPAPGALALVALAGFCARRRR